MNTRAIALCIGLLWGCESSHQSATQVPAVATEGPRPLPTPSTAIKEGSPSSKYVGDEAEARNLIQAFLAPGADHAALTREWKPTKADYAAAFEGEAAAQAEAHYEKLWAEPNGVVKPKDGQTEARVFAATTEDLQSWRGAAANDFPGGYKKVAHHFRAGLTWYAFKFVKPGETLGMAFDGLTFVNGHWVLFFKPWRAFADN